MLDSRQDKFAGEDKGLYKDSCKRIVKEQRESQTAYRLIDCVNENGAMDMIYYMYLKNRVSRGRKF